MGIRLLREHLAGALVAIGNAPTALLELLDLIDTGQAGPAAIVGMPVGLVAAAESKDELLQRATPYATVLGTRGGSPLAAAAVSALLQLAIEAVDG
jgi:precorrin-8X/cobalt-precorrin-8 methylmutase